MIDDQGVDRRACRLQTQSQLLLDRGEQVCSRGALAGQTMATSYNSSFIHAGALFTPIGAGHAAPRNIATGTPVARYCPGGPPIDMNCGREPTCRLIDTASNVGACACAAAPHAARTSMLS